MARRLLAALGAALLVSAVAPGVARAETISDAFASKVFVAVDSVELTMSTIVIRGVVQGDEAASAWRLRPYTYSYGDQAPAAAFVGNCQRAALIVQAKPGQYVLQIGLSGESTAYCRATRAVP
jgi:hypothetical protein